MAAVGLRGAMPSHNTVLDVPAHGSKWLINGVLRSDFNFDGVTLSDCNDIGVLYNYRFAANRTHAAALGISAGVDWDLQCGKKEELWSYNKLMDAQKQGLLDLKALDDTVRRILRLKISNGLLERPLVPGTREEIKARLERSLNPPAFVALARRAARESVVMLLRAEAAQLPWGKAGKAGKAPKQVALIGPTASSECNCSHAEDSLYGSYTMSPRLPPVTLDQAFSEAGLKAPWAGAIEHDGGKPLAEAELSAQDRAGIAAAVSLVQDPATEAAVLVLGDLDLRTCTEWGDRDDLTLQGAQLPLLRAVLEAAEVRKKQGPKPAVIVILVHGRPQTFGPGSDAPGGLLSKVDALFAAWRPGQGFGHAMLDLLMGAASPSGKLAHSWPRSVGQLFSGGSPFLQPVVGKWLANHRGDPDPDGRVYDHYEASEYAAATPLFRFGHGLSYTSFAYSGLSITGHPAKTRQGRSWSVDLEVRNAGDYAGAEVVQVYVQDPPGLPFVPYWKRLVGFAKVFLEPAEQQRVQVVIDWEDLALYSADAAPRLVLYPGTYVVTVGGDSLQPLQTASLVVEGEEAEGREGSEGSKRTELEPTSPPSAGQAYV